MDGKIRHTQFIVTVSGTTGTAATKRPLSGHLVAVYLDYSGSMAATANVTITRKADGEMPSETLLTVSNNVTDGWWRPRATVVFADSQIINSGYDYFNVTGYITGSVAQGTDGETVTINILYEAR